jgi:hypothetical protein
MREPDIPLLWAPEEQELFACTGLQPYLNGDVSPRVLRTAHFQEDEAFFLREVKRFLTFAKASHPELTTWDLETKEKAYRTWLTVSNIRVDVRPDFLSSHPRRFRAHNFMVE